MNVSCIEFFSFYTLFFCVFPNASAMWMVQLSTLFSFNTTSADCCWSIKHHFKLHCEQQERKKMQNNAVNNVWFVCDSLNCVLTYLCESVYLWRGRAREIHILQFQCVYLRFFLVFVMYEIGLTTSTSALIHANFFVRDSFPYDNTIFRPLDLRTIRSRHHFCWPRFLLALLSSSRLLRIYTTTKNVYCFVFVQMIGCLLLCTKWSVECLVRTKKVNFFRSFIVDFTHDATNASVFCCCFRFFFLEPWT